MTGALPPDVRARLTELLSALWSDLERVRQHEATVTDRPGYRASVPVMSDDLEALIRATNTLLQDTPGRAVGTGADLSILVNPRPDPAVIAPTAGAAEPYPLTADHVIVLSGCDKGIWLTTDPYYGHVKELVEWGYAYCHIQTIDGKNYLKTWLTPAGQRVLDHATPPAESESPDA